MKRDVSEIDSVSVKEVKPDGTMGREIITPFFPDAFIVHTVNGPVPCCPTHATKLTSLMAFMGAQTNLVPAIDNEECGNCRNEQRKDAT